MKDVLHTYHWPFPPEPLQYVFSDTHIFLLFPSLQREEELRKEEERKKVIEEREKFEKERMEQEKKEQEDREQRYREREQQIEEERCGCCVGYMFHTCG